MKIRINTCKKFGFKKITLLGSYYYRGDYDGCFEEKYNSGFLRQVSDIIFKIGFIEIHFLYKLKFVFIEYEEPAETAQDKYLKIKYHETNNETPELEPAQD